MNGKLASPVPDSFPPFYRSRDASAGVRGRRRATPARLLGRFSLVLLLSWGSGLGVGCSDSAGSVDEQEARSSGRCAVDAHCDDGIFCNGQELCAPGDPEANALGCVAGPAPWCDDGVDCSADSCDLRLDRCVHEAPDSDGDGFGDAACESRQGDALGSDCDDDDANIYPGAYELCDAAGVDEDCDPSTVGDRDDDGDGAISNRCCNGDNCGDDCNDESIAQRPLQPEFCDEVDNNCDGEVDNDTVDVPWYVDRDGDGFGVDGVDVVVSCIPIPGRSLLATDCNDGENGLNPAQNEPCDEVDNDCDGFADEGGQCPGDVGGTPVGAPGFSTSDPITEITIEQLCCGSIDRCKWANDGICDCPTRAWDQPDCEFTGGSGGNGGDGDGDGDGDGGSAGGFGGAGGADSTGGASSSSGGTSTEGSLGTGGTATGGTATGGAASGGTVGTGGTATGGGSST